MSTAPSLSPWSCLSQQKYLSLSPPKYTYEIPRSERIVFTLRTNLSRSGKTARSRLSCTSIRTDGCLLLLRQGEEERETKGREKKKVERRSRPSFYSVPCSSGMERRGEEGGKKNEEDNACSRVGAVLNGNRLASEVPGSWVTWRQGDTVAPPTVRWICRLAARLPQGRSFRVGVDPSGRRDARTPPTPAEPWRGKKSGYTTATVLPCRFRAAAFTLRG